MSDEDRYADERATIKRASDMVDALCKPRGTEGAREWVMSIPVRPDYDPDIVIGDGLTVGKKALKRLEEAESALQAAQAEAAVMVEIVKLARDLSTVVREYGWHQIADGPWRHRLTPLWMDLALSLRSLDALSAPAAEPEVHDA